MKINFSWEGSIEEDFVVVKEWKKNGKFRLYITDRRERQWGYVDLVTGEWHLDGQGSRWKDGMKPAVEAYIREMRG